jgi:hypothetical protein
LKTKKIGIDNNNDYDDDDDYNYEHEHEHDLDRHACDLSFEALAKKEGRNPGSG